MIISFFREEGMSNEKTSASSRGVSWWKETEIEEVTNMKSTFHEKTNNKSYTEDLIWMSLQQPNNILLE